MSATPWSRGKKNTEDSFVEYFGPVAYEYGLGNAIDDEVLTPYRYFPSIVHLEDDEFEEYLSISRQLARYLHNEPDELVDGPALRLLMKRARIIASARNKLPCLRDLLRKHVQDKHILVYCGDGRVEGEVPQETLRQVDAAVKMIGNELRMSCASYTATTSASKRLALLKMFEKGEIQVLVAIRCLDEGVDIPAARSAFILASSTNPRQFIQRRGRVLRRAPGKTKADIYDLIVLPETDDAVYGAKEFNRIRSLVRNEFKRAAEFAEIAENGPVARSILKDLTKQLNLFTIWNAKDDH